MFSDMELSNSLWVSSRSYFTGITFPFTSTTNTTQILQARKQVEYDKKRTWRNKQFNKNRNENNKKYSYGQLKENRFVCPCVCVCVCVCVFTC